MHDAITFEQLEKPALAICTTPFLPTSRMIARTLSLPEFAFALVDHPIGSASEDELAARASAAYAQGVQILLGLASGEVRGVSREGSPPLSLRDISPRRSGGRGDPGLSSSAVREEGAAVSGPRRGSRSSVA